MDAYPVLLDDVPVDRDTTPDAAVTPKAVKCAVVLDVSAPPFDELAYKTPPCAGLVVLGIVTEWKSEKIIVSNCVGFSVWELPIKTSSLVEFTPYAIVL
jgi:hypothetical protein